MNHSLNKLEPPLADYTVLNEYFHLDEVEAERNFCCKCQHEIGVLRME